MGLKWAEMDEVTDTIREKVSRRVSGASHVMVLFTGSGSLVGYWLFEEGCSTGWHGEVARTAGKRGRARLGRSLGCFFWL